MKRLLPLAVLLTLAAHVVAQQPQVEALPSQGPGMPRHLALVPLDESGARWRGMPGP